MYRYKPLPKGLALVASLALSSLGPSAMGAESQERFPEPPWGIDGPAGRCVVCHSLERGGPFRVAPNLWGVIGSEKARERDWYVYSPALLERGGVWSAEDLDAYLADADAYLPGTNKSISVQDPEDRRQIIEFLTTLKD